MLFINTGLFSVNIPCKPILQFSAYCFAKLLVSSWWCLELYLVQKQIADPILTSYSYGCVHSPWLDEHWRALKDHGQARIEIKNHQKWPVASRQKWSKAAATIFTTFSVWLCLITHNGACEFLSGPDASSSYFRKSITFEYIDNLIITKSQELKKLYRSACIYM